MTEVFNMQEGKVEELVEPETPVVVAYDDRADVTVSDGPDALAMTETLSKGTVYYIKTERGDPVDPFGGLPSRTRGWDQYKWTKVSQEVFETYLTFLKKKTSMYLHATRRMMQ